MRINHNIASLNTYRQLSNNGIMGNKSLEKLSSGLRINRAGDDAAGLAISEKMRGQIRGLDQASRNAQDAISLIQTAEGALSETHSILQRMRELATQASNDTVNINDRTSIQDEVNQLRQEIDRIANTTEFNTKKLLNGEIAKSISAGGANAASIDTTKTVAGTNTQAGVYAVVFTTAATQAVLGADATATANVTGIAGAGAAAGGFAQTFVLNGVSVAIGAGDTVQQVIDKINNVTSQTGVSAAFQANGGNGYIQLTSSAYGSDAKVSLTATNAALQDLFAATTGADTTVSDAGTDAVGTINGQNAIGSGNTLTLSLAGNAADGLKVVGIDGTVADTHTATITVGIDNTLNFQIGANQGQTMNLAINSMKAYNLNVATDVSGTTGLDLSTSSKATAAITTIDNAINTVSAERSKLGAVQNRLEHTINNLGTSSENLTAAESRIRDVDMAKEMMEFTKMNILSQAAQAMLAQANQQPQGVLQLLR
ncbi:MAG: flagellin [Bacillota bacterium]